ncbi:MAG: hypothetical protein JKX81_18890 [Arenicella sp.]|nr:hypothetical protein [Arenicella sp.]
MKNSFCQVDADDGMIVHGGYLVDEEFFETSFWHIDAVTRGVYLIRYAKKPLGVGLNKYTS